MRVVLRLSGEAEVEGGSLKTVTLGDRDFFIGRDPSCDWTVSDTLRMMSRRHCSLKKQGDGVLLTDLSSNGTSISSPGNRLVQGQPTPLPDTAVIYLGGDHVRVDFEVHREEAAADTPEDDFWGVNELKRARGKNEPRRLPADDDLNLFADENPDRNDPLSLALDAEPDRSAMSTLSLSDDAPAPRPVAPAPPPRPDDRMTFAPKAAATVSDDLFAVDSDATADDDDPFADWGAEPTAQPSAATPPPADSLSLDEIDPTPPPAPRQAAPDPLSLDPTPPPADDEIQPRPSRPQTIAPGVNPRNTAPSSVAAPARPFAPTPPPQSVQPVPAAPPPPVAQPTMAADAGPTQPRNDEADRMIAALFASLGIALEDVPPEKRHEMVAEVGRSFRALADGMRELLASRRDVKIALGLGATQIETGSNPLKFARDANDAVNVLVKPTSTGFLTGSTAVHDAVTALQQHQVALVGGVKASMKTALETFDPAEVERRIASKGLSQIIPMKRKAELWEQFVENYKDFAAEADEDIRRLIGKQLEQLYADEATRSRAALSL